MTLRNAFIIGTAGLLVAITAIALVVTTLLRAPEVPSAPGNYVIPADDGCSLHVIRGAPGASIVIHPALCRPEIESLGYQGGFTANTNECGPLTFTPTVGGLFCPECGLSGPGQAGCPLARGDLGNRMLWQRVE